MTVLNNIGDFLDAIPSLAIGPHVVANPHIAIHAPELLAGQSVELDVHQGVTFPGVRVAVVQATPTDPVGQITIPVAMVRDAPSFVERMWLRYAFAPSPSTPLSVYYRADVFLIGANGWLRG